MLLNSTNNQLSSSINAANKIFAIIRGDRMITITNVPKSTAITIYVPVYDAEFGETITSAAGLDSKVSKDGGAFYDCVNELTELGTTGIYTLTLTATEMNADSVGVKFATSTAGAKIIPVAIYTTTA